MNTYSKTHRHPAQPSNISRANNRLLLIGCGKAKQAEPTAACDLYNGSLFRKRRAYAEATERPWWILSAKYGLVDPNVVLRPYDVALKDLSRVDRAAWAVGVTAQLLDQVTYDDMNLRDIVWEIHAGSDYTELLVDVAQAAGFNAYVPLKGMSQGQLMHWYTQYT